MCEISLFERAGFSAKERKRIMFSIKSLVNDSMKIILIMGLSFFFKVTKDVVLYLIPFLSIRIFMGGIHKKTFLGCLISSMFWIAIGVFIPRLLHNSTGWHYLCVMVIMGNLVFKPIRSKIRKKKKWKYANIMYILGVFTELYFLYAGIRMYSSEGVVILSGITMACFQHIYLGIKEKAYVFSNG